MFAIDLLKGEGVPAKSGPEAVAVMALTIAVPFIVAIVMFGCAVHSRVVMTIQKQNILNYRLKTKHYAEAMELQASLNQEKGDIHSCMSEVTSAVRPHNQWSGVLVSLAENLPGSMVLTELLTKQRSVRLKVPSKDEPEKMIEASVPVTTLRISVAGTPHTNQDEEIRHFRDAIRACPSLEQKLQDIRVSQGSNNLDGQQVVTYRIDCIMKPQI